MKPPSRNRTKPARWWANEGATSANERPKPKAKPKAKAPSQHKPREVQEAKRASKRLPRPAVEDDGDATELGSEVESEPELVDCWTPEPKPLGPPMPVAAADSRPL
jgi:hypothetical protein